MMTPTPELTAALEIHPDRVRTPRLELLLATREVLSADLGGPAALGRAVGARAPADWPPGEWDLGAVDWMLGMCEAFGRWGSWYFVRREDRLLVGAGGFKGPPDDSGTVEIGYAIVGSEQRRGYATEAAAGLVGFALAEPAVSRIIAETLPDHAPSLGVLRRLGFIPCDGASEPGVVRLERPRTGGEPRNPL